MVVPGFVVAAMAYKHNNTIIKIPLTESLVSMTILTMFGPVACVYPSPAVLPLKAMKVGAGSALQFLALRFDRHEAVL